MPFLLLGGTHANALEGQVGSLGPSHTVGDFDGDGVLDRVFGYPASDNGAGAIVVVGGDGEIVRLTRDSAGISSISVPGDHFGDSLAAGDVDGDGYDDLAVGVPADGAFSASAGSVHIIYGSDAGLSPHGDQILHREFFGVTAEEESGAAFGEAVAIGDFNCDGFADVAVGAPFEDAEEFGDDVGAVSVLFGSSSGVSTVGDVAYGPASFGALQGQRGLLFGGALSAGRYAVTVQGRA